MVITAAETDDVIGAQVLASITLVESYVQQVSLSCTALHLDAGQTVQPMMLLQLVDNAPADLVTFVWGGRNECLTVAEDGTLTALAEDEATLTLTRFDRDGEALTLPVTIHAAGSLARFTLPATLQTIEAEAFLGVPAVQLMELPAQTESIHMPDLLQLVIPAENATLTADMLTGTSAVLVCTRGTQTAAAAQALGLPFVLVA